MTETIFSAVRAMIFDCDGTLVDSAPVYAAAWGDALSKSGKPMLEDWYLARNGLSEAILMDEFETANGVALDRPTVVSTVRETFLAKLDEIEEIAAIAGAARAARGYLPLAVASGGPQALVLPSLRQTGLLQLFNAVVTMDDVALPKPAPDLFVEAACQLGVEPQHCLVVEDSPTGMIAANAAGMQAVCVHDADAVAAMSRWLANLPQSNRTAPVH